MTSVGVSDMEVYVPCYYVLHEELAELRNVPKEKYLIGLGNEKMAIIPNWEDAVTMAANAAIRVLERTGTDPMEIQQLVVSTESGVDYSKAVASYVQELLNIGTRCRVYEVKHACYGGTAGLVNSIDRISRNINSVRKALVIMTDVARYGFNTIGEPTQGAGAVAMLVEKDPKLFEVDTTLNGIFSKNVFDFWRPTGHSVPIVDGKYSIECYLEALSGTIDHLRSNMDMSEDEKLLDYLDYVVYHMPFSKMAKKAHQHVIDVEYPEQSSEEKEITFMNSYHSMVKAGLTGAREVGNIYTGSVYMGLISLLEAEKEKIGGKKVGLFSYGSGCGAEFLVCDINENIHDYIEKIDFNRMIERRKKISIEHYTHIYSKNIEDVIYFPEEVQNFKDEFTRFIFTGIKDNRRQYV